MTAGTDLVARHSSDHVVRNWPIRTRIRPPPMNDVSANVCVTFGGEGVQVGGVECPFSFFWGGQIISFFLTSSLVKNVCICVESWERGVYTYSGMVETNLPGLSTLFVN